MAYNNDRRDNRRGRNEEPSEFTEKVVSLNRVSKTVKGGRVMKFSALCVVGCVMGVVQPTPENAKWPAWYLWTSYLVFLMPMLLIACYLLLDRRPVRRAIPALASLSVRQETRVGLLALIAIFVAWVLTSAAAGV